MAFDCIQTETDDAVGIITLDRPDALNAFNNQLMNELTEALQQFEADDKIGCVIITGSEKAFAAGADIREMADNGFSDAFRGNFISRNWEAVSQTRKPVMAAVAGYALGGGCELAMMCDFILAADNAKFSQPEITIGAIPGAGGTQRLPRAVGKAKAMELCLTGRMMDAEEAERAGLVARIVPKGDLRTEAIETARKIAAMPRLQAMMIKEAINHSYETPLASGVLFERRVFHATFATEDQKEGMNAFVEKRQPDFRHR